MIKSFVIHLCYNNINFNNMDIIDTITSGHLGQDLINLLLNIKYLGIFFAMVAKSAVLCLNCDGAGGTLPIPRPAISTAGQSSIYFSGYGGRRSRNLVAQ